MFGVVPAVLLLGLILIPIGLWLGRHRIRERIDAGIDDRPLALRRLLVFVILTAVMNVAIGTQATYRAVHYMESRQFCGSCHVMTPEATAFSPGPHAGLQCTDCHVGDGAQGWLDSKMQGMNQLWSVVTDQVPVPIPSAIESGKMVASEETCERCHWKERFGELNLKVFRRYEEDEANTPETTVFTMHVGGTKMGGIHGAHCSPGVEIRFVATDPARQDIPWVEYTNSETGESRTYVRDDAVDQTFTDATPITMQCVDCHNRAAHKFQLPGPALDIAFTIGLMSSSLPYLKKQGMEVLTATYESSEAAASAIPAALSDYYRTEHPEVYSSRRAEIEEAGEVVAALYARNVFPELGVTWGTYPDNSGHENSPGCYRCHEGEHSTDAGETITQSCFKCHAVSAMTDSDPEILRTLGLKKPIDQMLKK